MTMQYDVKSAYATADGQLVAGRVRLKSIVFLGTGTAGTFTLYDNTAASGTVLYQWKFSTAVQPFQILIPGEGILAQTGIYYSGTNVSAIAVCYG
jgi:outer membrane protein assembly factor BamB